ncbi:tetratricopeptide repeat-containing response regulator [Imhoffiella purpurea]|uniref:Chemotaxis regulator-transmits chemoreceptor signals to flagelllar motor components CheY n=1 Tax=Imhoffiella purpurea TaxID=1249627 RepID=W9VI17_9GAMM|nr:tetratricopeptide repeat-containing response regulator [Imhoffiella purpurea]EXJ16651.1 Chemotaxis regulator - transmits chemoreceptor signals to flagelllar motor components CheY [Imhoffiella purpurea]
MSADFLSKTYLVVDDFSDMRAVVRSILRSLGVTQVDQARDGKDAIDHMQQKRYDVVLCDYNLGVGKNGQQVLEEARYRQLIGVDTIFVMITAENTRDMVMGAVEFAPDSYLAKPFTKELLQTRLTKVFERKGDLKKVNKALMAKDYRGAIAELDRLLATKPKNLAELLKLKADACMAANRHDEALAIYEEVLGTREIAWARIGVGKVQFHKKDYAQAKETFTQLIEQDHNLILAYDWLAKTQTALHEFAEAEQTLQNAAKLSPRGLHRQQLLGDLALSNGNTGEAETAYQRAVSLAKHSVLNHPALFAGLAKSKSSNNKHAEALKVIGEIGKTFADSDQAHFYASTATAVVKGNQGDTEGAKQAMQAAEQAMRNLGDQRQNPKLALEMAKTYAGLGEKEKAAALLHQAIANNHDEDEFLTEIVQVCRAADLDYDAQKAIREIQQDVIKTNNNGVRLIRQGEFDAAIKLLREATEEMPANKTINLNTAKAIIMKMEKTGATTEDILAVRHYIDRVQALAPDDWRLADIMIRLGQLAASRN